MSYETIQIEAKDASRTHVLTGTYVEAGAGDNTANVTVDIYGLIADIPIFYHCPDSEAADGNPFSADDRVLITNSDEGAVVANMKVVGFEDGLPRECCYASESFITHSLNYEWLVHKYDVHGTLTNNSSFSGDKFNFAMTAQGMPMGFWSNNILEYYAKCFEKPWANNTDVYLIIDISDALQFSGAPALGQSFRFYTIFTTTQFDKWAIYTNTINASDFPAGLAPGIYYADVGTWLTNHGWNLDACTFMAYSIVGTAYISHGESAGNVAGFNKYSLCSTCPPAAILLGGDEASYGISAPPIASYAGRYKC